MGASSVCPRSREPVDDTTSIARTGINASAHCNAHTSASARESSARCVALLGDRVLVLPRGARLDWSCGVDLSVPCRGLEYTLREERS